MTMTTTVMIAATDGTIGMTTMTIVMIAATDGTIGMTTMTTVMIAATDDMIGTTMTGVTVTTDGTIEMTTGETGATDKPLQQKKGTRVAFHHFTDLPPLPFLWKSVGRRLRLPDQLP
jgi:hypothetical protein